MTSQLSQTEGVRVFGRVLDVGKWCPILKPTKWRFEIERHSALNDDDTLEVWFGPFHLMWIRLP